MEVQALAPLANSLRQQFQVEEDPADPVYQERHAAEMIEGFRVLCLLVFASMAVLLVVRLVQPFVVTSGADDAPTAIEQRLFVMHLEHRMRAFQGTFHANPDYALWYGWSEMRRDLQEIKEAADALRRGHGGASNPPMN